MLMGSSERTLFLNESGKRAERTVNWLGQWTSSSIDSYHGGYIMRSALFLLRTFGTVP
jgi:hypothetical protein